MNNEVSFIIDCHKFFYRFISLLGFLSVEKKKKDEKNVPY